METLAGLIKRRAPVFGIASLLAILIGVGVCLHSYFTDSADNAEVKLGYQMVLEGEILLTMICSGILALISIMRQESRLKFACIGLLLSISPIAFIILYAIFHSA